MTLYIVVPCYNEEEVLSETASRLKKKMCSLNENGIIDEETDTDGDFRLQMYNHDNSKYMGDAR